MKRKILLLFALALFMGTVHAQKTQKKVTAYAITGSQKGHSNWTEVRVVDVSTGDEVETIYKSKQEIPVLNARTGKPVVKKEIPTAATFTIRKELKDIKDLEPSMQNTVKGIIEEKINEKVTENLKNANVKVYTNINSNVNTDVNTTVRVYKKEAGGNVVVVKTASPVSAVQSDHPFATNSAACAYDKKHDRLYYTPMGINQLRYIDLKDKTPKIYYFEDEPFGALKNRGDVDNQITRMVIASDGNGYALTNDAKHLIQFTTGKKPVITDLGSLTNDPANGNFSVHNRNGYGGDVVADAQKNIYLITANRNVFRISLETKVATYIGTIKGLPKGFTTNGAAVDEGSKVIVTSSTSTLGYFSFDLNTMQAEKVSSNAAVYNASDLANGNLAFDKKKKEKKEKKPKDIIQEPVEQIVETKPPVTNDISARPVPQDIVRNSISVYPNPVTNGIVKLSFADQPEGRYMLQFMDISGKIIGTQQVSINNKLQVVEYRLPKMTAAGNYIMNVVSEADGRTVTNKLVVQ